MRNLLLVALLLPAFARAECSVYKDEGRVVNLVVKKLIAPECGCLDAKKALSRRRLVGACIVNAEFAPADGKPLLDAGSSGSSFQGKPRREFVTNDPEICGSKLDAKFTAKVRLRCKEVEPSERADSCVYPKLMQNCEYKLAPWLYVDLVR